MSEDTTDPGLLRLMTKVASLYYQHDLQQEEIARRLRISQSRVSRLLSAARERGIVKTVIVPPPNLHADLAEELEATYGLDEVHVIEVPDDREDDLADALGIALAHLLEASPPTVGTIGVTSWSRTLRSMARNLRPLPRSRTTRVVEMLGDVGPPFLQHEAAAATQRLADMTGAAPVFLRVPGVVPPDVRDLLVNQDAYALETLAAHDDIELAFTGVGTPEVIAPLEPGDNFFTNEEFAAARQAGAVGELNMRFLAADGQPLATPLDDAVVGITLAQLRACPRTVLVAGGLRKYAAIRAALLGGWANVLVTDLGTAAYLRG